MVHRHPRFVRAVTLLLSALPALPALATAACGQIVDAGGAANEPPPAMTGGGSPPTSQASSGSTGGAGGGTGGSAGSGGGTGGGAGSTCDFSENNPSVATSEQFQDANDVAVDGAGNVAVTGYFAGTLDLGVDPAAVTEQGFAENLFVAKLDPCGKALWQRDIPPFERGSGMGVAFDAQGDVLVAGYSGSVDQDILVAKLDPDGDVLWTRSFAVAGQQEAVDITTDASDDILVTGFMAGDVTFDNGQTLHGDANTSAFFAKLSPAGDTLWAKSFAGASQGRGIATDSEGNVIVSGFFEGTIDLGGGPLLSQGGRDVFLAKFNAAGDHVWSASFGSASDSKSLDVAVDSAGAILFTGTYHFGVDLGGGPLPGTDHEVTFLAKFSAAGEHVWSLSLGATPGAFTLGNGIAVGADDTVIVGGWFGETLTLCGDPLVSAGLSDIFVAKFSASGACLKSQRYGGKHDDRAASVALSPSGSAVLTGHFIAPGYDFNGMHVRTNSEVSPGSLNLFVGWTTP